MPGVPRLGHATTAPANSIRTPASHQLRSTATTEDVQKAHRKPSSNERAGKLPLPCNTPKNVYGGNAARLLSRRRPTEPSAFTIAPRAEHQTRQPPQSDLRSSKIPQPILTIMSRKLESKAGSRTTDRPVEFSHYNAPMQSIVWRVHSLGHQNTPHHRVTPDVTAGNQRTPCSNF